MKRLGVLDLCVLACMVLIGHHATALKFIVVPKNANSITLDLMGVASQLQSRGHSVVVVAVESALDFMKLAAARHSSNTTAEAMEYIAIGDAGIGAVEGAGLNITAQQMSKLMEAYQVPTKWFSSISIGLKMLMFMGAMGAEPCKDMVQNDRLMKRLNEFQADALMVIGLPVSATGDSCACLLSHALNVPLIDVFHGPISGPPSVPQLGSCLTPADLHTWSGYTKNLATWALRQLKPVLEQLGPKPWTRVRRDLGLPQAASACPLVNLLMRLQGQKLRECRALKEVLLGSWLVEYPRTLATNQVLVGPGTPRHAHPITPPDVPDFVDSAPSGVVLVAFGSTALAATLVTPDDFTELAQGFAALAPIRVLWALKEHAMPRGLRVGDLALGSNTKVVAWIDYNDVLGHPNTRVIVSHGGVHSVYEAAFHGVPMVAVPFLFEQAEHAMKYVFIGAGVLSKQAPAYRQAAPDTRFTRQQVAQLIKKVLDEPSYSAAAAGLSEALQMYAKRRHPYERAADEVELAVNTHHAQQQRTGQRTGQHPAPEAQRQNWQREQQEEL